VKFELLIKAKRGVKGAAVLQLLHSSGHDILHVC